MKQPKLLAAVVLMLTLFAPLLAMVSQNPVAQAGTGSLKVQYRNGDPDPYNGHIVPHFLIVNDSDESVPLSGLTIRYWFTIDGEKPLDYWCDYAAVGCNNLTHQFVKLASPVRGADYYLEVGFSAEAGVIPPHSDSGQIINRFNKRDWSAWDETNDYSFDATKYASYYDWSHLTLYQSNQLVSGSEPGQGTHPQPTITRPPVATATPRPTTVPPTATATPRPTIAPPTATAIPPVATATPVPTLPLLPTTDFVERRGAELWLDNKPFRITGANIYWLGLDENVGGVDYPTNFRVDDVLQTARVMGATVIRSHTLGVSVGCDKCLMPSPGNFNAKAFERIDYAIAAAKKQGLHLIIPLTDQWHYYHGGKHNFTNWRGYSDIGGANAANNQSQKALEANFYTDPNVIADFKSYVGTLLNHTNQYTGLAYKDDPTIMAWETGNEIWDATDGWTAEMARFIKNIAPRQLVSDGSAATGLHVTQSRVNIANLDIVGGHFYPLDLDWLRQDAALARAAGKVYYVGEYAWNSDSLPAFLAEIEKNPAVNGALFWSLFGHNDSGRYVEHNDGYTIHYPGDNDQMRSVVAQLKNHAFRLRGLPVP